MIYTSIKNDKIKEINKLKDKKYRDLTNKFLVEGYHLVQEAYKAGLLKKIILLEGEKIDIDCDIMYVTKDILSYLSDVKTPQNIMGVCEKKEDETNIGNKILVLDDIQDPGNLGTIIRSACAFNVDTIVLSEKTVDLYNSKVIRSTQGMMFNINIIRKDVVNFIKYLKSENYTIITTDVNNGKNIKSLETLEKICIIMGNEGNGVRKELVDLSDRTIYIKMNDKCESLNVAVATSIILYELGSE